MYTFAEQYARRPIEDYEMMDGGVANQQRRKRGVVPPQPVPVPVPVQVPTPVPVPVSEFPQARGPLGEVQPIVPPSDQTVPAYTPTSPHIGEETAGLSPLGKKLAEYRALSAAPVGSKVTEQPWGYEEQPPPAHGMSRKKGALLGALYTAAQAALSGPTQGAALRAAGGAASGAITGAASPKLVQAFERRQDLGQLAGDINQQQQKLELGQAQIGNVEAEAQARQMEPYLRSAQLARQMEADRVAREDKAADNTRADLTLEETRRLRTETERANRAREAKKPTSTNERVVQGQIFRKDDDGVWRVAPGSPPKPLSSTEERRTARSEEKASKAKQAASLYNKGAEYWDQAKAKRAAADKIPARDRDEETYKQLIREAQGLENKTREVQLQGDKLAAESEATDAGGSGGTFDLAGWKRDHPGKDTVDIIERAKKRNLRILE